MSEKHFTLNEQEQLLNNPYVLRVSEKSITYADEFKRLFIDQYLKDEYLNSILNPVHIS